MTGKSHTCFKNGTHILTGSGNVPIDFIEAGDSVVVLREGRKTLEPVTWIGHSAINLDAHAHLEDAAPICIRQDALAANRPTRDLYVSPEHCLIINGRCVPAKLLVNGGSIVRDCSTIAFSYHHLELQQHGILIAEGVEAESYLDTGNRYLFDNAPGPRMLHPRFEINAGSDRWTTDACAPLVSAPEDIVPIWQALADRSAALGFTVAKPAAVPEADLHIIVDGRRIDPSSSRDGRYVFAVPAGSTSVSVMSRFFIPADKMIAQERDTRRLGVRVDWIAIRSAGHETILSADNPALQNGWHNAERAGLALWRWTDGAAMIPWNDVADVAILTIRCSPASWYPVQHGAVRLTA